MQNPTAGNTLRDGGGDDSAGIIIIGAGIIGLSTAFYLSSPDLRPSTNPRNITVLDSSPTLFACASGRAGGFLAKDWFAPAVSELGQLSFKLHRELADARDGRKRWGYGSSVSYSLERRGEQGKGRKRGDDWLRDGTSRVDAAASSSAPASGEEAAQRGLAPAWLNAGDGEVEVSSSGETTAQLDPHEFCQFLLEEVRRRGVNVRHPVTPLRVTQSADGRVEGLVIVSDTENGRTGSEEVVLGSRILVAAGPWSDRVFQKLFPSSGYRLPITSLAGHSIVIRSPLHRPQENKDLHAVFASIDGLTWHPEAFSRVNGDIYLAGLNSATIPLPDLATDVRENDSDIQSLLDLAGDMVLQFGGDSTRNEVTNDAGENVIRKGLCHRPVTPAGKPILARIPDAVLGGGVDTNAAAGGVFVATGHGPWGISMSLGTGKVMAEMMMGEETTVDVSQLGLQ